MIMGLRKHQELKTGWLGLMAALVVAGCASDPVLQGSSSSSGPQEGMPAEAGNPAVAAPAPTVDSLVESPAAAPGEGMPAEDGASAIPDGATVRLYIFNASRYRMGVVRFADAAECKGIVSTDRVPAGEVMQWSLPVGQPFSFGGRFLSSGPRQGRCLSYATFTPEPGTTYQAFWRASEEDGRCAITLVDKSIMDETGVMRDALVPYEIRTPAFPNTREGAFCAASAN